MTRMDIRCEVEKPVLPVPPVGFAVFVELLYWLSAVHRATRVVWARWRLALIVQGRVGQVRVLVIHRPLGNDEGRLWLAFVQDYLFAPPTFDSLPLALFLTSRNRERVFGQQLQALGSSAWGSKTWIWLAFLVTVGLGRCGGVQGMSQLQVVPRHDWSHWGISWEERERC